MFLAPGGAGGMGSWLGLLARIGIPITIFDDDVLEIHLGQCFTRPFLGMQR